MFTSVQALREFDTPVSLLRIRRFGTVARVSRSTRGIHQGLSPVFPVFAKCPGVDRIGTVPGVLVVRQCFECTVSSQDLPLRAPRQELNSHRGQSSAFLVRAWGLSLVVAIDCPRCLAIRWRQSPCGSRSNRDSPQCSLLMT